MWIRSPRLVGRKPELGALLGVLLEARTQRGGAAFVVGEAGIGKSRLAMELADVAVADGVTVLRGRGSSIGPMVPFRPVAEALLTLARDRDVLATTELGPYLPALGVLVPDWRQDTESGASLIVIAEAVLRLLTAISQHTGCLLVLDDLHDADTETLFIVEYLVDNLAGSRTLLVGTIRSGRSDALSLARSAVQRGSSPVIELTGLDRTEIRRMAAACLDSDLAEVPEPIAERLWRDSMGSPFVVEELLHEWVTDGLLAKGQDGWQLIRDLPATVPAALVGSIAARTEHFGQQGVELLATGAILGHRFPVSVVQQVSALDDRQLLSYLRAGVAAQLIAPDEKAAGWYAFRHPLTAEALLAQLTPAAHGALAGRVADAVESLHPGLPGEWCPLVASLRLSTGDRTGAGLLFAEAGKRALSGAAADSAVILLTQADDLLTEHPDLRIRGTVREQLVYALGETGRFERAFGLATSFAGMATAEQTTALHVRLAWVAYLAGRYQDGLDQVAAARALLGAEPEDEHTAPIDAVHANLLLEIPGPDHARTAERLARSALSFADRAGEPAVACQSLQALGIVARERDLGEAERHFDWARRLSEEHQLPLWRTHILMRLAGHRVLANADTGGLELARREATRLGAITATCAVDVIETLNTVLCGDFDTAERRLAHDLEAATRFQLPDLVGCVHATRAILAAHQGRRHDMDTAIDDLRRAGAVGTQDMVLCLGLGRAFCALLEEDVERARRELAAAAAQDTAKPSGFRLTGQHGLRLLLDALAGDRDLAEHRRVAAHAAGQMRWNRQFVRWADAVLLGRQGDRAAANDAATEALVAAEPYRMARHLAVRLVAAEAARDGWGDPIAWLRGSEEHFHRAAVPAVASACRALLRDHGEPVRQRRSGVEQVPPALRAAGITVREYDVFRLLAERYGNRDIAQRLHISPKTVEKHVASLLAKTRRPNRVVLTEYAASVVR